MAQSGRNLNTPYILFMSSIPTNLKWIRKIVTEKKWQHRFLDAQWQLTLWSMVGSGRISNSPTLVCRSSLPASMKMIWPRTAERTWQHRFPIIRLWGFVQTLKGSLLCSRWSDLTEFRTPLSSHACHHYL